MTKRQGLLIGMLLLVASMTSFAQDSLKIELNPYASFRGHFAHYNEEIEIQENASRIGVELSVSNRNIRFFVGAEFGVNLFRSPQIFNTDGNTSSGFTQVIPEDINVFSTRLGYLGADFGKGGVITLGKQWSAYYDVTGYTDKFNVFGGRASATYTGSSDGGDTGTGRASQALSYRNTFGNFSLAGQMQFKTTFNDKIIDGLGLSVQYEILSVLRFGVAYNRAYFDDDIVDNALGFGGQPEYLAFGLNFLNESWDVGLVFVNQTNGDAAPTLIEEELVPTVYDAKGIEAFLKFKRPRYSLIAGYNGYNPDKGELPFDPAFDRQDIIFGAEYKPSRFAYFYGEYRIASGSNSLGVPDFDVITLGIRLDFNQKYGKYLK